MSLFSRAAAGFDLTPGERAFLKVAKGLLVTAVGSGLLAAASQVSLGHVNWQTLGVLALGAAAKSLHDGVSKYYTAQGDPVSLPAEDVPAAAPSAAPVPAAPSAAPAPAPAPAS